MTFDLISTANSFFNKDFIKFRVNYACVYFIVVFISLTR